MALQPFGDRDGYIWYNGSLMPWREANFHVLSHGLHYASCVFEGERAYGGKIFKMREHSDRLINSGKILGFDIPYTADQLDAAKMEVVKANNLVDCYVRPVSWRGGEQMGVSAPLTKIHTAIAAWEWPSYFSPEIKANGIKLTQGRWARPAPNTAPVHAKASGLYMICTVGKSEAEAKGFHDCLMLDYRGNVAEATGANFFMLQAGKLHTPTPDCFLNGITRQTVIELAGLRQIPVVERFIKPDELKDAEEIFVTGTAAEITPVGQIDDLSFKVGPTTRQLMEDYAKLVRA
ncbi:MAG: branched-chain amino acid aminotransferase [Alphaproteobacteria bacterium]|nr:branched-chain amino acid aminotransferase [Alphaproteobacteria bacterium]